MIDLVSIEGQGVGTLQGFKLNLDSPLTVIYGNNKDRKKKGASNAVGKSLLVSIVPNLIYGTMPVIQGKKDESKKILNSTGSFVRIGLKSEKDAFVFEQSLRGSTANYSIEINGKEKSIKGVKDARALIAKLVPMNREQFYSLAYIDSRINNPIQMGTPARRFDIFESLFDLGVYDLLSQRTNKLYAGLVQKKSQYDTLKEELELSRPGKDRHYGVFARFHTSMYNKLRNKLSRLNKMKQQYSVYVGLMNNVSLIKDDSKKLIDINRQIKKLQYSIQECTVLWDQYMKSIEADRLRKDYEKAIAEAEEVFNKYKENKYNSAVEVKAALDGLLDRDEYLFDTLKLAILAVAEAKEDEFTPVSGAEDVVSKILNRIAVLKAKKAELSNKTTVCPTCGHALTKQEALQLKRELKSVVTKLSDCYDRLNVAKRSVIVADSINKIDYYTKKTGRVPIDAQEESDYHDKLTDFITRQERYKGAGAKLVVLKSKLASLPPFIDRPKVSLDNLEHTMSTLSHERQTMLASMEARENLAKYGIKSLDALRDIITKFKALDPIIREVSRALDYHSDKRVYYATLQSESKAIKDAYSSLEARILKLDYKEELFTSFTLLKEACGSKGSRISRIRQLAELYAASLNAYAPLIFPERIVFKVSVTKSQFSILADRNGNVADVNTLSNSESRAFSMLSLLALMSMIPKAKRPKFLILDEPENGMDQISRNLFVRDFIPSLMKIIGKIVLVTPTGAESMFIPNAKVYTVEKYKGKARLVCE